MAADGGGGGILVIPTWDGYRLARASRVYYHHQNVFAVVAEPPTRSAVVPLRIQFQPLGRNPYLRHASHSTAPVVSLFHTEQPFHVRIPLKPYGRNPYLRNGAGDVPVVVEPSTFATFFVRVAFKPFGRNPYLRHAAHTTAPTVSLFHTEQPFLVRVPFKPYGRNPYLRHGSVEGPEQQPQVDDTGSNLWVVPVWDRFRLARAQGFYYRGRNDALSAPELDTYTRRSVRVPFKPFGHTRYILSTRRDDTVPPQDSQTQHLVRVPFRPFGHNLYIRSTRRDDTIPPEPSTYAPYPPHAKRFRDRAVYRRNRYVWSTRVDEPVVVVPHTTAPFFVRLRFKTAYARNRHLFTPKPVGSAAPTFQAGWADESTITINMRRIDRGVIA